MSAIRNALAMSAIPVPEALAMEALAELDGLEEQLEAVKRDGLRLRERLNQAEAFIDHLDANYGSIPGSLLPSIPDSTTILSEE